MEDKQLEQMLYDLGKEEVQPSKELIERTKTAVQNRNLYYLIGISIVLNALMIVGFIMLIKHYSILKSLIQWTVWGQLVMSIFAIGGIIAAKNQFSLNIKRDL